MTSAAKDHEPPAEWRHSWRVAASGAVCYAGGISMYQLCIGFFIVPMQKELGWSTSALTLLSTLPLIAMIVCGPLVGVLTDRIGSRIVVLLGLGLIACGYVAMAVSPAFPWLVYSIAIFIGVVGPMSGPAPISRNMAAWFERNIGGALGVVFNGLPIVALAALPILNHAIQTYGWRAGFIALAGLPLLIALPFALAWFKSGQTREQATQAVELAGTSLREALRQWRFWAIMLVLFTGTFAGGGFLIHLQPLLAAARFDPAAATALGVLYATAMATGKLGTGFLVDRFWSYGVAAAILALAGAGNLMLFFELGSILPLTALAIFLIGLGHGAESSIIAYFPLRMYGLRHYSTIMATMTSVAALEFAAGGMGFARIEDVFGHYRPAILLGSICFLSASALVFWLGLMSRAPAPAEQQVTLA